MLQAKAIRTVVDRARRQGGVISRNDAFEAGVNDRVLAYMVRTGTLVRMHRGVYALPGAAHDPLIAVRAALVAAGPDAVASHATAGWLQGMVEKPPAVVHVTIPRDDRPPLAGVRVHRCRPAPKARPFRGVRCTDPVRTILDMAATATPAEIDDAVDRALAAGTLRLSDLEAEAAPTKTRRRGTAQLRRCLKTRGRIGGPNPSVLESVMARLFRRYRLPVPRPEVRAGSDGQFRIDYAYPEQRVAIELYGYAWHHSPDQLTHDLGRQRALTLEGWTVLVFTWHDITTDPGRVAAEIRAALSPRS
jgi:very-short-patch-repair endonuclease